MPLNRPNADERRNKYRNRFAGEDRVEYVDAPPAAPQAPANVFTPQQRVSIAINKKTGSPVKLESRYGNPNAGLSSYLAQEKRHQEFKSL